MKTQCTSISEMTSFFVIACLVSDNCKQSITVWFLRLTFYWHCCKAWYGEIVLQWQTAHADASWARTWCESHHFQYCYPRALLRKSAVESTALGQQFCVNQAVGDLRPATCSHISGTMLIIDCGWKVTLSRLVTAFDMALALYDIMYITCSKKLTYIASLVNHIGQTEKLKKNELNINRELWWVRSGPVIAKAVQGRRSIEGFVEKVGFEPGVKKWRSDGWREWWWWQRWADKLMRKWVETWLAKLTEWIRELIPETGWCRVMRGEALVSVSSELIHGVMDGKLHLFPQTAVLLFSRFLAERYVNCKCSAIEIVYLSVYDTPELCSNFWFFFQNLFYRTW